MVCCGAQIMGLSAGVPCHCAVLHLDHSGTNNIAYDGVSRRGSAIRLPEIMCVLAFGVVSQ
jgi:hypothetical protein